MSRRVVGFPGAGSTEGEEPDVAQTRQPTGAAGPLPGLGQAAANVERIETARCGQLAHHQAGVEADHRRRVPGRAHQQWAAVDVDQQHEGERWFERANARTHRRLRCRPSDRLPGDLAAMAPLPAEAPDLDPRIVLRVPPDPYVRVDACDYSLDPRLVGRRVEVRVGQREITAVALDSGDIAAAHRRSFARHRTLTDPEHLRLLRAGRGTSTEPEVEARPLARYDALIPA